MSRGPLLPNKTNIFILSVAFLTAFLILSGSPAQAAGIGAINVTLNTTDKLNTSTANYTFQYTPVFDSSKVTMDNCTLWGNFSGGWKANQTNQTNIVNETMNNISVNVTLPDDTYKWNVKCYNTSGSLGKGNSNRTITVDTAAPSVTNLYRNVSKARPSDGVRINATVDDGTGVGVGTVLVGNGTNVTMTSLGSNAYEVNTTPNSLGCSEGSCILTFYANDTVDNVNYTETISVTVDDTPPSVELPIYQNETQKRSDQSLTLNVSVTDSGVGVDSCLVSVEGQSSNESISYSDGWCNGTIPLSGSNEGNSTISVYSNDTVDNWGLNDSYVVWIDDTPPEVTINKPTQFLNTTSSTNSLNVTVTDDGSGVDNETVYFAFKNSTGYFNASGAQGNWTQISNVSATDFNTTWSAEAGLADGDYAIFIKANDTEDNLNNTEFVNVTIDNTKPSAGVSVSDVSEGSSTKISCSESDSLSGVYSTSLSVKDPDGDKRSASCDADFTETSEVGTYSVTYKVTDYAGNSKSKSTTFDVNALGGGGGGAVEITPSKTHSWLEVQAGETQTMKIEDERIGFSQLQFTLKNRTEDVEITVKRQKEKPVDVEQPEGKTYRYAEVDTKSLADENIKEAKIQFSVNKSWASKNNLEKGEIYLQRYTTQWKKLETDLVNETENKYLYRAATSGFSYFAVSGEKVKEVCPYECCVGMAGYKEKTCPEGQECQDNSCAQVKECPACPEPTNWSGCVNGTKTRTNYRCSAETNYQCGSYQEEKSCEVPEKKKPKPAWPYIIIVIIVLIVAVAYWQWKEISG